MLFCIAAISFIACTKPGGNSSGHLESFTVEVKERIPNRAIIDWTEVHDIINGEVVRYTVFLGNVIIDSNLLQTEDTLYNLSGDVEYTGTVLAFTQNGDTVSAHFTLPKISGYLLFGTNYNSIRAVDPFTGASFWENPLTSVNGGGTPAWYTPVISHDTVFIHNRFSVDQSLFALNLRTGQLIWSALPYSAGFNTLLSSDITYNGGILYGTSETGLKAIDAKNGQLLWNVTGSLSKFGVAQPLVSDNVIYVGSRPEDRYFYALNASNGSEIWHFRYEGQICARPLVIGNLVIIVGDGVNVYALNKTTGQQVWKKQFIGVNGYTDAVPASPVLINNNTFLFESPELGCFALNVSNGATVWNYEDANSPSSSSATVAGDVVYYSYDNLRGKPRLIALYGTNGTVKWRNEQVDAGLPIYANNRLYLRRADYYGTVDVVNASDGTLVKVMSLGMVYRMTLSINNTSYYYAYHGNYP